MEPTIKHLEVYQREFQRAVDVLPLDTIARVADEVVDTYKNNGTVYFCGNGGNAAYCGNAAADLSFHPFVGEDKGTSTGMRRLRVVNLSVCPSTITALANDRGFEEVYAAQLERMIECNDLVFGFTGSGNSANILRAFEVAKDAGASSVCISRGDGGEAKSLDLADYTIILAPTELGLSEFPGMTGKNNYNFIFEDLGLSSVIHMITGIMWQRVREIGDE